MIFIDNKYTKIYFNIVNRAKTRDPVLFNYLETHHIIPKCFYKAGTKSKRSPGWLEGNPDELKNLVDLTPKEHFICHLLLIKMVLDPIGKSKMAFALSRFMYSPKHRYLINSRKYNEINALKGEASRYINKGKKRTAPISEETRTKLSEAGKRRKGFSPQGLQNVIAAQKNKVVSEETKSKLRQARIRQVEAQGDTMTAAAREKLSMAAKGRILSEDHKQKISESHKGKIMSEETKLKMRDGAKNRTHSEKTKSILSLMSKGKAKKQLTCPHCSLSGGEPQMKRWHFDKCKYLKVNMI